jgi:molecular chaperone HscA
MALFSINLQTGTIADEPEKDIIVGIDLGTTNSLVAYMRDGHPVCVADKDGKNTLIPSVLHFLPQNGKNTEGSPSEQNQAILVGDAAKEKLESDPQNTIYSVKRLMGKAFNDVSNYENYFGYKIIDAPDADTLVKIRVGERYYSPIELSSFILKELKSRVETELKKPISKAVITVPAYFNDAQRQATRDAGRLAGLDVLRIVNEPTAAALAYGLDRRGDDAHTIAVYDLGGGTFDVSILQIQDGVFEVLATNGDTFLGGDDIDRAIVDYWLSENNVSNALIQNDKELGQSLRLAAEKAKKMLSNFDELKIQNSKLNAGNNDEKGIYTEGSSFELKIKNLELNLDIKQFNSLILPLVQKTINCCVSALKDAQLTKTDIQAVVMVGGSTRVPLVKKMVSEFFDKPVFNNINPDEVVALGAAIQADVLAGNQRDILLIDVTPLSLGIETVGGLMDTIIPRNSKIPTKAARQYTTSVDGQRNLKIAIYQGERDLVEHNRKLGELVLRGIPPMPAGFPKIDIAFYLDADGILRIKAKELRSEVEQEITVKASYGLTDEEMALMLLDSIRNAEGDLKIRALQEARNEGNNIVLASEKFLIQHKAILSAEEQTETAKLAAILRGTISGADKDAINKALENLNTFTEPLAHRAMDVTISEAMMGKAI